MLPFARKLAQSGFPDLRAQRLDTLQVNLGWRCNQACRHCHLAAGPDRPEQMELATVEAVIKAAARWSIPVVDLTGGSPEINPHFEYLVQGLDRSGHPPAGALQPHHPSGTRQRTPAGIFPGPPGGAGLLPALFPGRPGGPATGPGSVSQKPGGPTPPEPRGLRGPGFGPETAPDV